MKIERTQLLTVLSESLDSVEKEVFGVAGYHAKRVAWLCIQMARKAGMTEEEISDVAVGALLHDNALNEYRSDYENGILKPGVSGQDHCVAGEENLHLIPGCDTLRGFVLYHHESADGMGPFGKKEADTPFGAQLIHIADEIDLKFSLGSILPKDLPKIGEYLKEEEGKLFGKQAVEVFLSVLSEEMAAMISDDVIETLVLDIAPVWIEIMKESSGKKSADIYSLASLFARIIDYKSPFTKNHSIGIANKAQAMAYHYNWEEETAAQLYFAAALHDIGKLMVKRDVLEKPGRLDEQEYQHIQTHAYETYRLLSKIDGLGKVTEWASYHHEKLNGKGYPFGKKGEELDQKTRLLACLDIYQALTEDRPYKAGMPHQKAISILKEMAEKNETDTEIISDIDQVFHKKETGQAETKTALFQCPVCGYIYEGDAVPYKYECPVCGQPETAFLRVL